MNEIVPISRDDQLLEAASRWMLRLEEGLSARDQLALEEWLDEDSSHREVLVEVADVWGRADVLARLAELFPHSREGSREADTDRYHWWQRFGLAASFAMLVLVGVLLATPDRQQEPATVSATYATTVGERKPVLLPDGSELVLNTDSHVAVTFTASRRVVRLAHGEVLVRVAEDRNRPLSVIARDRIIQAVGTEFSVEITNDQQVELIVTEGKVVIGVQPSHSVADAEDIAGIPRLLALEDEHTVAAGEIVDLTAPELVKTPVSAEEIEVRLSWRDGRLIFRSEPLEKALKEIERYTAVEFVIVDETLKTRTLSGRFRAGDVEALLLSLTVNFDITYEFDGQRRVLLSSL